MLEACRPTKLDYFIFESILESLEGNYFQPFIYFVFMINYSPQVSLVR
jgi:hypothetical protein